MSKRALTDDDVRQIRELHAWKVEQVKRLERTASTRALAEKFGVGRRQIWKVVSFQTYKDVL